MALGLVLTVGVSLVTSAAPGGKGHVELAEHGNSYRTRLSLIGGPWVRLHAGDEPDRLR